MNKLLEMYESLRDNLSNIFSIVGIVLTVYFAVFYVPNYVERVEERKIQAVHESLIESIQELTYNNHKIDANDLETLIRGKELSRQIKYPYTSDELLIQVQNKFLENQFIPLEQRKNLIEKIDEVRESLPPVEPAAEDEKASWFNLNFLVSILSVLVGLGLSAIGAISVWVRSKEIEEIKIETKIEDREEFILKSAHAANIIERQMYDQLKEILGADHVEYCPPSTPVDFLIRTELGRDVGVELKYTQTGLIPLRVANQLASAAIELKMPVVLLANASPSTTAKKRLVDFNEKHPETQIKWLNIDESENLKRDIQNLFA